MLTGNAGDGKTHLLHHNKLALESAGALLIEDATASMRNGDPAPVLDAWRAAAALGRPVCLAANEYPLYQLRLAGEALSVVREIDRQCRRRLAYGPETPEEQAAERVIVIDLSLRNPLARDFMERALDCLLDDLGNAEGAGRISERNRPRLTDPRVRIRLRLLFDRLIALGQRATVRELWILIARLALGTREAVDVQLADWYSELLFTRDTRFPLTEALRAVDPAMVSHPQLDLALEAHDQALRAGWTWGVPPIPPQPELASDVFSALKRAFYFEHERGEEAVALADSDSAEFVGLLTQNRGRRGELTSRLVAAINSAYCPVAFSGREHHLYLWTGHRFHEQPSRSFVAVERIAADDLTIEVPRLPTRVSRAFDYRADHLALVARELPGQPRLILDFALFRTLGRLARGLPRKLVPERDIHRLDAFLERLAISRPETPSRLWSVHLERLEVLEIGVSPDLRRYEQVRVHG